MNPFDADSLARIGAVLEVLRDAVNKVRMLSNQLHPSLLDLSGVWMAIASYAREFDRETGIRINIEIRDKITRLTETTEIGVFRIVQECLNHIQRYSATKRACIRVAKESCNVTVTISGFDNAFGSARHGVRDSLEGLSNSRGGNEGIVRLSIPTPPRVP